MSKHLSASQISTLFRCPRQWAWKYIENAPEAPIEAFIVGKAFHDIVDSTDPKAIESQDLSGIEDLATYPHKAIIAKMAKVTRDAAAREGLPAIVAKEVKVTLNVSGSDILGYADAVRHDPITGQWWITERKTASRIDEDTRRTLRDNLQIQCYVTGANHVATEAGMDAKLFAGVSYEVTSKPAERIKKEESHVDFVARATVNTAFWQIPYNDRQRQEAHASFASTVSMASNIRTQIEKLHSCGGILNVPGNTQSCTQFGRKCSFFELCHGGER